MTKIEIISTQKASFKFLDIFDNREDYYCLVSIKVEEKKYENGNIYYDISYGYQYSHEKLEAYKAHPFNYNSKIKDSDDVNGVIVVKNHLTETFIQYLLMSREELESQIGNTWWLQYKIKVMEALNIFWD